MIYVPQTYKYRNIAMLLIHPSNKSCLEFLFRFLAYCIILTFSCFCSKTCLGDNMEFIKCLPGSKYQHKNYDTGQIYS